MTRIRTAGSFRASAVLLAGLLVAAACGSADDVSATGNRVAGASATPAADGVAASADPTAGPPATAVPEREVLPPAPGWTDPGGNTLRFTDVSVEVGMAVSHDSPFGSQKDGAEMMGGAAVGDFNNDGWQDLYFIGGGNNPDALFINDGDGTFTDMAEAAGITDRIVGSGATVGDYNNDGWLDIFVTSHGDVERGQVPGTHHLYRNNGDLTFTNVAEEAGVATTSREDSDGFGAAFGDYDLDGDLDLFVAGWVKDSLGNRLFRNDGDGTFTDVTEEAGIIDNGIRGFSPCIVDMNGDRYPEILLVADFGTTKYFRNSTDGTFVDLTPQVLTSELWSGMGTAVGDFNADGLTDWYTTEIFDDDNVGRGLGNKLYLNLGDDRFEEVGSASGVDDGGWGWGAVAVDLNLDGRLDIVETNGWRLPAYDNELAKVWIQGGDGVFIDIAQPSGLLHRQFGLGVTRVDIDNDGDQDIAIASGNDEFHVYENQLEGTAHNWLRVFLDTSANPALAPNGLGATVSIETTAGQQYSSVVGCSNYLSASELSAHFGLGDAAIVDKLVVTWPDGLTTELVDVTVNQTLTVEAPAA